MRAALYIGIYGDLKAFKANEMQVHKSTKIRQCTSYNGKYLVVTRSPRNYSAKAS